MLQLLSERPTKEKPHVIRDYPTGFVLRCQKRVWVEYRKGYGYRRVSQTSNPRADGGENIDNPSKWCAPKLGTYSAFPILIGIDPETGYIEGTGLWSGSSLEDSEKWLTDYGHALMPEEKTQIEEFVAYLKAYREKYGR